MFSFFTFVTATNGAAAPMQYSTRTYTQTLQNTHRVTWPIVRSANIGVSNVSKAAARGLDAGTVGNCQLVYLQFGECQVPTLPHALIPHQKSRVGFSALIINISDTSLHF